MDIGNNNLIRSKGFWDVVLPRVKEQVPTLDRECTQSLSQIIRGAGEMQLQDNELWESLESKLVDEGLLRYFTISETADILYYFAKCGRGSDKLHESLEGVFIKHRKHLALHPECLAIVKAGYNQMDKSSEILKRVLEDPTAQLP